MNLPSSNRRKRFQQKLLEWYKVHSRDLPWRRTQDPYAILVSELMLQQTQVNRVIEKYNAWMKQYPTPAALASASKQDILKSWQGLGYNRRALYLQRACQRIVDEYGGIFPQTREELLSLPGIGPYTAGALLSFAFHKDEAIVDTNVTRVLGRVFVGYKKLPALPESDMWSLSEHMLPAGNTYYFNQALMDFGATTCTLRAPQCGSCPFARMCSSYPDIQNATPEQLRCQKKVEEKQYFGHPRRIWRGRILQHLNNTPSRSDTYASIGNAIQGDAFTSKRMQWLKDVVATMKKDGVVSVRGNRVSVAK